MVSVFGKSHADSGIKYKFQWRLENPEIHRRGQSPGIVLS